MPQYQQPQPDPWEALLKSGLKYGTKKGASYLNDQLGLTDSLKDYLSNILGLGGGGGAASFGVLASDIAPLLGQMGPSYGVLASDAATLLGSAAPVAGEGAFGGLMGGLSGGGGIPIAAALMIIQNIIQDEINDPGGRVSAAQDRNYLNQQQMPEWIKSLAGVQKNFGSLNDTLTDPQLQDMFRGMRTGAKNQQLMADPLSNQGKNEYGIKGTNFGPAASLAKTAGPLSVLGTIRAQDIAGKRGLELPEFETATDLQRQLQKAREHSANQPGAGGEYTSQYAGLPSLFNQQDNLAPLKPLRADEALGMLGFHQANLAAPENAPQMMAAYGVNASNPMPEALKRAYDWMGGHPGSALYTPDIMEKLYAMQPGGYEQGLLSILGNY